MILDLTNSNIKIENNLYKKGDFYNKLLNQIKDDCGWIDYPNNISNEEIERIKKVAYEIRSRSQVVICIGVGGSYIGGRSVIEALNNPFYYLNNKYPYIIYCGHNLSKKYLNELISSIENYEISLIVISKSGTTLEPSFAFDKILNLMNEKYSHKELKKRIITITDEKEGKLREITNKEGYINFNIPSNIGGRFSVLTPVGLLPIAIAGYDIEKLLEGAKKIYKETKNCIPEINPIIQYAIVRNELYKQNKKIEIMGSYEPCMYYFLEWWKQLFGESEGKEGKGIFPTIVNYTTDLHSLGQYIQEGERLFFETIITNKTNDINNIVNNAVREAHIKGNVPQIEIIIPEINEFYLGELIYFFEKACAISAYLMEVNPFNQPGVEKYKEEIKNLIK